MHRQAAFAPYATSIPSSSSSSPPYYRRFLPTSLSSPIPATDPIPSLDDLGTLRRHLVTLRGEAKDRAKRLDRDADSLREGSLNGKGKDKASGGTAGGAVSPSSGSGSKASGKASKGGARAKNDRNKFAKVAGTDGAQKVKREISETSPESDDDDEMPAKPGRRKKGQAVYVSNHKKRKRDTSSLVWSDEDGYSSVEETLKSGSKPRSGSDASVTRQGSTSTAAAPSGGSGTVRLKLNNPSRTKVLETPPPNGIRRLQQGASFGSNRTSRHLSPSPSPLFNPLPLPSPSPSNDGVSFEIPTHTPATAVPVLSPSVPPEPGPTRPEEVNVDFTAKEREEKAKEKEKGRAHTKGDPSQNQVPIQTFYNHVGAYFKTITEDDLAFLTAKSEDVESFIIPPLGRHYTEVWEEEDAAAARGGSPAPTTTGRTAGAHHANGLTASGPHAPPNGVLPGKGGNQRGSGMAYVPKVPPLRPSKDLSDEKLFGDPDVFCGPFTERLLSALLDVNGKSVKVRDAKAIAAQRAATGVVKKGREEEEDAVTEVRPEPTAAQGLGQALGAKNTHADGAGRVVVEEADKQTVAELEERVTKELKQVDVIDEQEVDWSLRDDDEIAATLRRVQSLLRAQLHANELRKARLYQIAQDRMAHQEYESCLHSLEREIEAGWTKRQRQIKASLQKKRKGGAATSGDGSGGGAGEVLASVHHGPAKPQLPDSVLAAMRRRKEMVTKIGPMFQEGRDYGTPVQSIYADLDLSLPPAAAAACGGAGGGGATVDGKTPA